MDGRRARCYWIIDNQVYEEESKTELEVEFVGSNDLEEQELYFMVGDMPIPFGYSTLTLPIDI